MSLTPVECANCGAKYRLPETFKADKAKCKKCGAMIDVASQRAAPPAAEPARAKPATASSSRRAAPSRRASAKSDRPAKRDGSAPSRTRRSSRARGGEDDGGDEPRSRRSGRSRRGEDPEPKKSNTALIAGSVIGVLAVVLVVVIFVMQGGDDKANENQQATAPEGAPPAEEKAVEQAAEEGAGAETADEGAPEETSDLEKTLDVEPKAEEAAAKKPEQKAELSSHEDVFKPRDDLEPLPWPDFVSEEEQAEITEGLQAIRDGGIAGTHAKTRLEELDGKAVVGIVNQLRDLNYFDSEDTMFAYELNRLLGAMSTGINADFRPCELGAEISLEDADWNGKTVKAWRRFAEKYGQDTESLPRLRALRRSKNK